MSKARLHSALFLGFVVIFLCAQGQDSAESALEKTKPPVIDSVVQEVMPPETPATPAPQSEPSVFTKDQEAEFENFYNEVSGGASGGAVTQDETTSSPGILQRGWEAVAVLFFLCGVIILLGYAVRRFGRRTPFLAGADLGSVLGRVYLGPRASLHYVKSGGRILVIGVTQNNVQLITEFDESEFGSAVEDVRVSSSEATVGSSFLQELQTRVQGAKSVPPSLQDTDDSIASLRGELQRLQQHLGKSLREPDA